MHVCQSRVSPSTVSWWAVLEWAALTTKGILMSLCPLCVSHKPLRSRVWPLRPFPDPLPGEIFFFLPPSCQLDSNSCFYSV